MCQVTALMILPVGGNDSRTTPCNVVSVVRQLCSKRAKFSFLQRKTTF